MTDLNRIGGGIKLIQKIIKTEKSKNAPWSRQQQIKKIQKQKNYNPPK